MLLKEKLKRNGDILFRGRSYFPLVAVGLYILAMTHYHRLAHSHFVDYVWEVICLSISFTGLFIRIFTVGYAPSGTSGRNTKRQVAHSLNTTGAYSVVRNPLYLANFLIGSGVCLFAHLWWVTLIYILGFWLYYERIILAEEAFLEEKFGSEYREWMKKTPVFIPNFKLYKHPDYKFNFKKVLRKEGNTLFAIVLVMFMLEVYGDYMALNKVEIDMPWLILLCVSGTIWLILRILKKHTKVLKHS